MPNASQMTGPRLIALAAALALGSTVGLAAASGAPYSTPSAAPAALPKLPPATRGPVRILFSPTGDRAYVLEKDEGAVAVLEARTGKLLKRLPTGGQQPTAAAALSAHELLVAHTFSGSVTLLNTETGARRDLPLRGEPSGIAVTKDGRLALVTLAQLDEVAVLDLPALTVKTRIPVGRRPRAIALSPDGSTALVAALQSGQVSTLDIAGLRETRRAQLTGVNLRDIVFSADGKRAYVSGQIPANTRSTDEPLDIWTNTVFRMDLRPEAKFAGAEGWIDFSDAPSSDPDGLVAYGAEERVAVVVSGSDEVLRIETPGPHMMTYDPVVEKRVKVGPRPRGLTMTPDRKQLWVASELDNSVTVLDAGTLATVRRIDLGTPGRVDVRMPGRYLFGSSKLTKGGQFSCASCHPDGGSDGLQWEFVHVPDGLVFRNSRSLRGGITETAPFRWSGHEKRIEDFFQDEVRGLLHGPALDEGSLQALRRFVEGLSLPANPYRAEGGAFSAQGLRGKALFEGKAGCAGCHNGPRSGGTGTKGWVGTTPEGRELDVPHLAGSYDSPPYLHDARADTLEDIFRKHNREKRHGSAHTLSDEELADVLRYVREL